MVYAADKHLRDFLGLTSFISDRPLFANPNYEDPTYPIFHIRFLFDVPELHHPDYVSNNLLLRPEEPESAVQYLNRTGEPERSAMLSQFIIALENISKKSPWFFQGITGLDGLYKLGYGDTNITGNGSSYRSSDGESANLTITTLDSIDFRLHFLKDLYRKSTYDRRFKRWILPVNMRRFRMQIMVGDFRKMAITEENFSANPKQIVNVLSDMDIFNTSNAGGKVLGAINDGEIQFAKRLQWWDEHFSCMVFDCQDCEFDMTEFTHSSLSHTNLQSSSNALNAKFSIKVGKVVESNTYSLLEYVLTDYMFGNVLKNNPGVGLLKNTGETSESTVLKLAKEQEQVFKPTLPYWSNYQSLEREKGDNKRILLENRDIESALNNAVNQGLGALGDGVNAILGGDDSVFGNLAGDLGVADFIADTASEAIQDALGLGTEELVKNIFSNEIAGSLANAGLGALQGDLNTVAQNLTNPSLLGVFGINVESSNGTPSPNAARGIPKNIDLQAASVQRSLSDVTAQLVGEGADPRFISIGRPGQSLFDNPTQTNTALNPVNVELSAPRVETNMPDNADLQGARVETKLNPKSAELDGGNPKTTFDDANANLVGSRKLTTLSPRNAELDGADPLKDLNPSNASLVGADPLKDLNPSNADLIGADALEVLNPTNADLNGARVLDKLNPSTEDLTGAGRLDRFDETNVSLLGANPIIDMYQRNMDMEIPRVQDKLSDSSIDLESPNTITSINESNIGLIIPKTLNSSILELELNGADPIRKLDETNVDFEVNDLPIVKSLGNENLRGQDPIRGVAEDNVNLSGFEPNRRLDPSKEPLVGKEPLRGQIATNVDLDGAIVNRSMPEYNAKLSGPSSSTEMKTSNVNLEGNPPQQYIPGNVGLIGAKSTISNESNANLTGAGSISNIRPANVGLEGQAPITSIRPQTIDFNGESSIGNGNNVPKLGNINLGIIPQGGQTSLGNAFTGPSPINPGSGSDLGNALLD